MFIKMDYSANFEDLSDVSLFSLTSSLFESTPKTDSSFLYNASKKRKFTDIKGRRKLNNFLQSPSANISNESLSHDFQNIKIESSYCTLEDYDEPALKYYKNNGCEKIETPPSTPESIEKLFDTPKKPIHFQKCSSACSVPSPLKEQHGILYPDLKPLVPQRKPLTPQKLKEKISRDSTSYRKVISKEDRLIGGILTNVVIMGKIFSYISDGDLFRLSEVSRDFKNALERNSSAKIRLEHFKDSHAKNKENYKITPPSSPETQPCYEPVSPRSQKFKDYIDFGSQLNFNQTLNKCPRCERPSIVENSITVCQNRNCGYIYCQKCQSFAFQLGDFIDPCQGITLAQSLDKKRKWLEDVSNNSPDCTVSSILNSTADHHSSIMTSGYMSGYDTSHTASVKRNLSKSFGNNGSISKPQRALFDSNRSLKDNENVVKGRNCDERRKSLINIIPVVQNNKKRIEIKEPSSPPPKIYSACSKQSKKMLKRLTR